MIREINTVLRAFLINLTINCIIIIAAYSI